MYVLDEKIHVWSRSVAHTVHPNKYPHGSRFVCVVIDGCRSIVHTWPLLPTWINFNPNMDK